jgi:hypothetical protein
MIMCQEIALRMSNQPMRSENSDFGVCGYVHFPKSLLMKSDRVGASV